MHVITRIFELSLFPTRDEVYLIQLCEVKILLEFALVKLCVSVHRHSGTL
jgi:hypothetical protein